jgi:hypothetical protein
MSTSNPYVPRDDLQAVYEQAVCAGGAQLPFSADEERLCGPLELLALTTTRTQLLAVLAAELLGADAATSQLLADELRRHLALVIRLAHRALEVHARDVGYATDAWHFRAVTCGGLQLDEHHEHDVASGLLWNGLERATRALAAAIVCICVDRMSVPGHVTDALGDWLAAYVTCMRASR